MMRALLLLLTCCACLGQGFSLRDAAFSQVIGSGGAGGGGGSPGGGGGSQPPAPTEWWDMSETADADRVGEVSAIALVNVGAGDVSHATGLHGNALYLETGATRAITSDSEAGLAHTSGDSISLSWWTYYETDPADGITRMELTMRDNGGTATGWLTVEVSGGSFFAWLDDNSNYDEITDAPTLTTSTWHHWVVTYDGSSGLMTLHVDGTLVGTTGIAVTLPTAVKGMLRVGTSTAAGATTRVDEIGLWMNHKLTENERTFLNASGAGVTYPFP